MRSLNKHPFRIQLLVAAMSGALVASAAFAQTAGTSTPSPTQPSIGAGTAAPPSPPSAASTSVGTTPPASPLGTNSDVLTSPSGRGTSASTIGAVPNKSALTSSAFDMLDTGKRGFVTRDEAAKLPGFDSAFQQADENSDDRLSEAEFARAWISYSRQP